MLEVWLTVCVLILASYILLIGMLSIGVKNMEVFQPVEFEEIKAFSIVVAFRDECENLPALLESISKLNYPKAAFELILVNDFSSDTSVSIVQHFIENHPEICIQLLNNDLETLSPKKQAIKKAVNYARYEWILTTDADCVLKKNHLKVLNSFLVQNSCTMVAMPVIFKTDNSLLDQFQQFDLLSLMGATQGSFQWRVFILCNGANLCFNKKNFVEVNGYEGNDNIASGDDIFLMEKFLALDNRTVSYLKSEAVIVFTQAQNSLKSFVQQRIRWAAKTTALKKTTAKFIGLTVFVTNLLLCVVLFLPSISVKIVLGSWLLKMTIDYILLKQVSKFYKYPIKLPLYVLFSFVYPFYVSFIAFLSLKTGYVWKGRYFLR